jgi:TonB family protein
VALLWQAESVLIQFISHSGNDGPRVASTIDMLVNLTLLAAPVYCLLALVASVWPFSSRPRSKWQPLAGLLIVEVALVGAVVAFQVRSSWLRHVATGTIELTSGQPVTGSKQDVEVIEAVPEEAPGQPPPSLSEPRKENGSPAFIRKSGDLLQGSAIRRVEPAYPPVAKAAHVGGAVTVEVTVDEDGSVMSATALSGHPLLKGAAVQAARGWKFSPTKVGGVSVKVIGTITFYFTP